MSCMQEYLANVDNVIFDVEVALDTQLGAKPLPFTGMDKTGAAICVYYLSNSCELDKLCPFRHVAGDKSIVCKHWLRGLCKKGDQCEFLHEYDLSKMPECYFFSKYNACSNKECPFRHVDPESKIKDCPWYDRGFCRNGPHCKHKHRRKVMCLAFLNGFCPEGPECKHFHPRFELPIMETYRKSGYIVCHHCGEPGHKVTVCPRLPLKDTMVLRDHHNQMPITENRMKPLHEVTCYKCGEKGHYANKCSKGALAFLSQTAHLTQEIRMKDEEEKQEKMRQGMTARRPGQMQR